MVGSQAVIFVPGENNGQPDPSTVQVYDMQTQSVAGVIPANSFAIDDIEPIEGINGFVFSRAASDGFDPAGTTDLLFARHETSAVLAYHTERLHVILDLAGGEGGTGASGPTQSQRDAHGALMVFGWGILIPIGIIVASGLKHLGPIWFQLHRAIQLVGLVFALASFILALMLFNVTGTDTPLGRHRVIGIAVMSVGLFQPLNAFIRPHAPDPSKPKSPIRSGWEVLHRGTGYVVVLAAIVNIYIGMSENRILGGHSYWYIWFYSVILLILVAVYITMTVMRAIRKSRRYQEYDSGDFRPGFGA